MNCNPIYGRIQRIEARNAVVLGNDDEIRVSIENILENQLKYSTPNQEKDLNQIFKSF